MWYYNSLLKTYKPNDEFWDEHRQVLIKKLDNWIAAWLQTIHVISTPLCLKFPSLQALKAKGLMTELEYQSYHYRTEKEEP